MKSWTIGFVMVLLGEGPQGGVAGKWRLCPAGGPQDLWALAIIHEKSHYPRPDCEGCAQLLNCSCEFLSFAYNCTAFTGATCVNSPVGEPSSSCELLENVPECCLSIKD